MKTLILFLMIPICGLAQWDQHAHFWGSATLTFGLHFKLGKQETFKYPAMVMSLGVLKEVSDYFTRGNPSMNDIRCDLGGCIVGFMASDIIKRKRNKKYLTHYD